MLSDFPATANAIAATTKKSEKERILAAFLTGLDDASLERAVVFFAGSPFPRKDERVTGVGWSTIAAAVEEATGRTAAELGALYPRHADLSDTGAELIAEIETDAPSPTLSPSPLGEAFERLPAQVRA